MKRSLSKLQKSKYNNVIWHDVVCYVCKFACNFIANTHRRYNLYTVFSIEQDFENYNGCVVLTENLKHFSNIFFYNKQYHTDLFFVILDVLATSGYVSSHVIWLIMNANNLSQSCETNQYLN